MGARKSKSGWTRKMAAMHGKLGASTKASAWFMKGNPVKHKRKKNLSLPGFLVATKKNGKRVKANTSVKISLRDLRRLVSGARKGKSVRVKARVR